MVCRIIALNLLLMFVPGGAALQAADKECQSLMKQIDDLVDQVADVSQRMGRVEHRLEKNIGTAESLQTDKHTLETDKSTLRKHKLKIDNLLDHFCACCAKKPGSTATGQRDKECQALIKQINDGVDSVVDLGHPMGRVEYCE